MELIDKQEAIDTILGQPPELHYPSWYAEQIRELPTVQLGTNLAEVGTDLISRQAAIDALNALHYNDREDWCFVLDTVEFLPPAQPEIIHCKDCKHYQRLSESCRSLRLRTGDDWYCADAERKGMK